jgi:hypothetical protein
MPKRIEPAVRERVVRVHACKVISALREDSDLMVLGAVSVANQASRSGSRCDSGGQFLD